MILFVVRRTFFTLWLTSVVLMLSNPAQCYEAELGTLAQKLVQKLEAAKQHSATVLDFTDLQGASTELGR